MVAPEDLISSGCCKEHDHQEVVMPGKRLTEGERVQIESFWRAGWTFPEIGTAIGRAPSTVWREVSKYNSHRHGHKNPLRRRGRGPGLGGVYRWGYDAGFAHARATARARRPKTPCLTVDSPLREAVIDGLRQQWAPTQIAGRLRRDNPDDESMQVSHETIYQAIYVQSRGGLRQLLGPQVLRSGRARRVIRRPDRAGCDQRRRRDKLLTISARPAQVADRAVPGHWEGDLIMGARRETAIATLAERSSRFLLMVALPELAHRDPIAVADALAVHMLTLPVALRRSLTWDRGLEMVHGHATFSLATQLPVYFADPHSPWQRGTNENINGLIRQYLPKGTPLPGAQADLDRIADLLNHRPRHTLGWQTPAERLNELLRATAA
jgi:IS30 family transposase